MAIKIELLGRNGGAMLSPFFRLFAFSEFKGVISDALKANVTNVLMLEKRRF